MLADFVSPHAMLELLLVATCLVVINFAKVLELLLGVHVSIFVCCLLERLLVDVSCFSTLLKTNRSQRTRNQARDHRCMIQTSRLTYVTNLKFQNKQL